MIKIILDLSVIGNTTKIQKELDIHNLQDLHTYLKRNCNAEWLVWTDKNTIFIHKS